MATSKVTAPEREQRVTPWFSPDVKPVRVGWYDVRYSDKCEPCRYYWGECDWENAWLIHPFALPSVHQQWEWRGLASDPRAK